MPHLYAMESALVFAAALAVVACLFLLYAWRARPAPAGEGFGSGGDRPERTRFDLRKSAERSNVLSRARERNRARGWKLPPPSSPRLLAPGGVQARCGKECGGADRWRSKYRGSARERSQTSDSGWAAPGRTTARRAAESRAWEDSRQRLVSAYDEEGRRLPTAEDFELPEPLPPPRETLHSGRFPRAPEGREQANTLRSSYPANPPRGSEPCTQQSRSFRCQERPEKAGEPLFAPQESTPLCPRANGEKSELYAATDWLPPEWNLPSRLASYSAIGPPCAADPVVPRGEEPAPPREHAAGAAAYALTETTGELEGTWGGEGAPGSLDRYEFLTGEVRPSSEVFRLLQETDHVPAIGRPFYSDPGAGPGAGPGACALRAPSMCNVFCSAQDENGMPADGLDLPPAASRKALDEVDASSLYASALSNTVGEDLRALSGRRVLG